MNVKATTGTATNDWFFTLRADNYGWGDCYSNTDNMSNFNWSTFQADQNGATVDMYVNYSKDDQKVRTYVHTTTSDGTKTYFYYNTSSAITGTPASVYIALCEQFAKLVINTAEKVTASKPNPNYLYSRTAGAAANYTNAWDASDISASSWVATNVTPTVSTDTNGGLCCSGAPSGGYNVKKTFVIADNAKIKYEGIWNVNRVTGRDNNFSYIQFGDKIRVSVPNGGQFYLNTDGTSSLTNPITGVKNSTKDLEARAFSITINTASKTVESFTFSGKNLTASVSGTFTGDFNSFTIGYDRGGSGYGNQNLTSLTVSQTEQVVTNVDYTINYQLSGTTVKTVEGTSVVGETITALTAIDGTEEGYVGIHYLSTSAEASTMKLVANAASNVLNVPVRAPYTATYRLTKNINGNSSYVDYPFTETDGHVCSYAVGWPMYEKTGDDYYLITGESNYAAMGSFTNGQLIEKTVNYTTAAADVVWFKDINGGSVNSTSYSGGSYADTNQQLANVTVDAGVYDVIFNVISKSGNGSNHRNEGVSVNGENVANLSGNTNGMRTLRIIVKDDNSTITANGNGASNYTDNLDYVIIRKKMDGTTVAPTITAVNYGTYSSDYALDFEHATGIQAYYSTATAGGKIIMTKVNSAVAAGEGLFIEKIDGDISIPVVASGATLTGNKLKAGGVEAPANSYVFANQGGVLGFYKLTSATNIPKGKAYMEAGTYGARLTIMFDDETTGISELKQAEQMNLNETVYNLRGQRMDKPGKGLFIVNGHKVVVK